MKQGVEGGAQLKCGVQIALNTRSSYQSFPLALTHWDTLLLFTLCGVVQITGT